MLFGRQPDRITYALGFEELVDFWIGKGRITAKIETLHGAPVAGDHRRQHYAPAPSALDVTGSQSAPLDIAQLTRRRRGRPTPILRPAKPCRHSAMAISCGCFRETGASSIAAAISRAISRAGGGLQASMSGDQQIVGK